MEQNQPNPFKTFAVALLLIAAGVGILVLGIFLYDDMPFGSLFVIAFGVLLAFLGGSFIKNEVIRLRNTLTKKEKTKLLLSACGILIVLIAGVVFITGFVNASDVNKEISALADETDGRTTTAIILRLDKRIPELGPVARLFVHTGQLDRIRQENEQFITRQAQELSGQISSLEPCTAIGSREEYSEIQNHIASLLLDEESTVDMVIREKVANYSDLLTYQSDFYALVETYKELCSRCGGRGSVTCDSCEGRGQKAVKWYSEGDWGEVSYSSYECTSCDGRGRRGCSCSDGYVYNFD